MQAWTEHYGRSIRWPSQEGVTLGLGLAFSPGKGRTGAILVSETAVNDLQLTEYHWTSLSLGAMWSPRGTKFRFGIHLAPSWRFKSQLFWQISQAGRRVEVGGFGGHGGERGFPWIPLYFQKQPGEHLSCSLQHSSAVKTGTFFCETRQCRGDKRHILTSNNDSGAWF